MNKDITFEASEICKGCIANIVVKGVKPVFFRLHVACWFLNIGAWILAKDIETTIQIDCQDDESGL